MSSYMLLIAIAFFILSFIAQIFLSLRKNKWLGIIPAVFLIIISIAMTGVFTYQLNSYVGKDLEYHSSNGHTLRMMVRLDKNGDAVDFSHVSITDTNGNLIDSVSIEFGNDGEIIENDYSRVHMREVKALIGKMKLTGYPTFDRESEQMIKAGDGTYFHPGIFLFIVILPCIALLLTHFIFRSAMKKKRMKRELEKIDINNL